MVLFGVYQLLNNFSPEFRELGKCFKRLIRLSLKFKILLHFEHTVRPCVYHFLPSLHYFYLSLAAMLLSLSVRRGLIAVIRDFWQLHKEFHEALLVELLRCLKVSAF